MKDAQVVALLGVLTVAALPICPDPHHPPNERPVPFWIWLFREIYELIHREVGAILSGKYFAYGVDLGCGTGKKGPTLKSHVRYLEGVDHHAYKLESAINRGYDYVVCADIRNYEIDDKTDIVFLFDVIEHIPHEDGEKLLRKLNNIPHLILTTPSKFHPVGENHHVSLWTENELRNHQLNTKLFSRRPFTHPRYGEIILGWR